MSQLVLCRQISSQREAIASMELNHRRNAFSVAALPEYGRQLNSLHRACKWPLL